MQKDNAIKRHYLFIFSILNRFKLTYLQLFNCMILGFDIIAIQLFGKAVF